MSARPQAGEAEANALRPFFVVWSGQALSLFGSQLVQFALVWWLTRSTGSATVLAMASLMGLLPQVLLSPVAGALVDRWNRKAVMAAADAGIALATVALAALYALDAVQVWEVYALMLLRGVGGAFHWPAMQASTSLMVPEKHLGRVAGLNQALWGASNIAAPPLGALLLELLPMSHILAIDVATAMTAVGALAFAHVPQPVRRAEELVGGVRGVLADVAAGWRLVWGWMGMRYILLIAMLINLLCAPAYSLTPILVTRTFGGGAMELAGLESAMGIGMVAGGLLLGVWGGFRRRIYTSMAGLILLGVGNLAVGTAPSAVFAVALAGMLLCGIALPIVNGSIFAVVQATVPPEMQGRVFTLMTSGCNLASPLGLAIAGPVADVVGVQPWFVVAGVAVMLLGGGGSFVRDIVRIEERGGNPVAATNGGRGRPLAERAAE